MFLALAGSEIPLSVWATSAPPPSVHGPSNDLLLSGAEVQTLPAEPDLDWIFEPIRPRLAGSLIGMVPPVTDPARTASGSMSKLEGPAGRFWCVVPPRADLLFGHAKTGSLVRRRLKQAGLPLG